MFEVGADGWPVRRIEVYDNGPTLRYGTEKLEDQYGGRGQAQLDADEDWASWEITKEAFDDVWFQGG